MKIRGSFEGEGVLFAVAIAVVFWVVSPLLFLAGMARWATEEIPVAERRMFWGLVSVAGAVTVWWLWVAAGACAALARGLP